MKDKIEKVSIEGSEDQDQVVIDSELFDVLGRGKSILMFDGAGGESNEALDMIGSLNDDIVITFKQEDDDEVYTEDQSLFYIDKVDREMIIGLSTGKERLQDFLSDIDSLIEEQIEIMFQNNFRAMDAEIYVAYLNKYIDFQEELNNYKSKHKIYP